MLSADAPFPTSCLAGPLPWRRVVAGAALCLAVAAVGAQPPDHAGGGKGRDKQAEKSERKAGGRDAEAAAGTHFTQRQRAGVQAYFEQQYAGGKSCPPGLARKHNGCQPPGQARKWRVGRPLPTDVKTYPVPQPVLVQLPPVPAGHKYVQVAGDILLIAVGTAMVVDGIEGLLGR